MADQLEEVHNDKDSIKFHIKNARELLKAENVYMAAETLQKIICDQELNKTSAPVHKIIIQNCRKFAYQEIMQQAGFEITGKEFAGLIVGCCENCVHVCV